MARKRSKSSARWVARQQRDVFVQRAGREGFRSRAVYKLAEIDESQKLLQPGQRIVDLGASPGGWSQYAARALKGHGAIYALDLLPMEPIAGVDFIQGDFAVADTLQRLESSLAGRQVDLVMCDMAPNISGNWAVDQPRAMHLADLAMEFAMQVLGPEGDFLIKLFQGEGFDDYVKRVRDGFERVKVRKPAASRPRNREVYLLARNYCL